MPNPYVNKVVYGNETIIDLTGDDVLPADVRQGVHFHGADGAPKVGTSSGGVLALIASGNATPSSRTLTITGVTKAPKVIELYFEGTTSSISNTKPLMVLIVCDGNTVTALYALTVTVSISDKATVTTDTSAFSVALNGTTLTITCNTSGWFTANYKYALWG